MSETEIRMTPVEYAAELALAWEKGYIRGALDQAGDIDDGADPHGANPYGATP